MERITTYSICSCHFLPPFYLDLLPVTSSWLLISIRPPLFIATHMCIRESLSQEINLNLHLNDTVFWYWHYKGVLLKVVIGSARFHKDVENELTFCRQAGWPCLLGWALPTSLPASAFCSGWGTSLSCSASSGIPPFGSTYTHLHRCRADLVGDANHDTNSESFWTLFEVVIDTIEENHSSIVGHSFVPGDVALYQIYFKRTIVHSNLV